MPRITSFILAMFLTACTVPSSQPQEMNGFYIDAIPREVHRESQPAVAPALAKAPAPTEDLKKKLDNAIGEAKSLRETLPK